MKDFDCITAYAHFRKLPYILSIASLVLNFILSAILVGLNIHLFFGISAFGFLLLWWGSSILLSIIICYLTAVLISPIIIRTTIAAESAVYGIHLEEETKSQEGHSDLIATDVVCPSCNSKLSFTQRYIPDGRKVMCLRCGKQFTYHSKK